MSDIQQPNQQATKTWVSGFYFSLPVAVMCWIGLSSGLNNIFWPLTIICVLISFPWNLLAGFLVGLLSFPLVSYFNINGYLWLVAVFYSALAMGAHFNGYLFLSKKNHR